MDFNKTRPWSEEKLQRYYKENGRDRFGNVIINISEQYEDYTKQEMFNLMVVTQYGNPDGFTFRDDQNWFFKISGLNVRFGPKTQGYYFDKLPDLFDTIEAQRKKISGLCKQMQEMSHGYRKKMKRLYKEFGKELPKRFDRNDV